MSRLASGKRLDFSKGHRVFGPIFAYDRAILEACQVVRRLHFAEKFSKPPTWTCRLVASADTDAVDAVLWAFQSFRDGSSQDAIAKELNRRGVRSIHGKRFRDTNIRRMMKTTEVAEHMDTPPWPALRIAKRAALAVLIVRQGGHRGGWIAATQQQP